MKMPSRVDRAKHYILHQQWVVDRAGLTRRQRVLHHALRTITLAVHGFITDRCALRAAALTLVFTFSLAPALALGFSVAKGFGAQAQIKPWIYDQLGLDDEEMDPDNKVQVLVDNVLAYVEKTNVAAMGAVGLVLVVYAAYSVLASVEKTMNDIWRVRKRRPAMRKIVDYIAILVVLPLMMIFTSLILGGLRTHAGISVLGSMMPPLLVKFLGAVATVAFASGGLWFLYYFFPCIRVPPLSALAGAVVAAVFWALAQYLYIRLQVGVAKYNAVYGTFAAVPIFLLWLQCAWLVVLFGAEVAYAHATQAELDYAGLRFTPSAAYRERAALGIMALAAKAFKEEKPPPSIPEFSREFSAPIQLVRSLVADLQAARLLVETSADAVPRYGPAAPLEQITLGRILRVVAEGGEEPPGALQAFKRLGIADAFQAREEAEAGFLNTTLDDFVRKQERDKEREKA